MLQRQARVENGIGLLFLISAADDPADGVLDDDLRPEPAAADTGLDREFGGIGVDDLVSGTGLQRRLVGKTAEAVVIVPGTDVPIEPGGEVVVGLQVAEPGLRRGLALG